MRQAGARNVQILPNGADFDAFARGPALAQPADLAAIPRPRILYAGKINRKVDLPLLVDLARAHPDWQFILIGARNNDLGEDLADAWETAHRLSNVHLLGHRHHSEVPAYMGHVEVNTMLYRTGPGLWTEGGYPLKLHEYLATGRPVVGTALPSVEAFSHVVATAASGDRAQWSARLDEAVADRGRGSPAERRRVAAANTWAQRTQTLDDYLACLVQCAPCP